jgi:hypothetical protein
LIFHGFENEKVDSVHEKVVVIENSLKTFQKLQKGSNDTLENVLDKMVLKTELIVEIAKLVDDLIISYKYISSNETCKHISGSVMCTNCAVNLKLRCVVHIAVSNCAF